MLNIILCMRQMLGKRTGIIMIKKLLQKIVQYMKAEKFVGPPIKGTCKIPPKNYSNINELIKEFNMQMMLSIASTVDDLTTDTLRFHTPPDYKGGRTDFIEHIYMVKENKKVYIAFEKTWVLKTSIKIRLHPSLAYQLGFSAYIGYDIGWHSVTKVLRNTTTRNHYRWEATREFDLNRNTLFSICVFCNIIESVMVGDKQMPLMRYLPVDDTTNQIPLSLFMSMTYNKVNKGSVNAIKIWLTEDIFGEPIKFNGDVHVKLLFEHR